MIKVIYYSKSGNTKALADAIASAAKTKAISVDEKDSKINQEIDILFIGGALYMYGLDSKIVNYIKELDTNKIKKAVVFSTSWISKHSISLIKEELLNKNIDVVEDYIYYKNMPSDEELKEAQEKTKRIIKELKK